MIFLVHPIDPTIKRLRRIVKYVIRHTEMTETLLISPGDAHKKYAHKKIEEQSDEDFIVFLGHGRSDALFGSKGIHWTAEVSSEAQAENPQEFYNDENFISSATYHLLNNKKMFCFACNSVQFGKNLEKHGVKMVLLGFDKLPTTSEEFQDDWGITVSKHMLAATKGCLNVAVRQCVIAAEEEHREFGELEEMMKFELQKQISYLLSSKARYRYQLANVLATIKANVMVVGDRSVRI